MAATPICSIPGLVLSVIAFFANAAVVFSIFKRKTSIPSPIFTIGCICLSNSVLCGFHSVSAALAGSAAPIRRIVLTTFIMIQMVLHSALAYDRWTAVAKPHQYRQQSRVKASKRITLTVLIATIAVGIAIGVLQNRKEYNITPFLGMASRLLLTIILALAYFKIYKKVKENNNRVSNQSNNSGNNSVPSQMRKKDEKYLLLMSMWISVSFLVFNIPLDVFSAFKKGRGPCKRNNGIIFAILYILYVVNSVCDPIAFFVMERRRKGTTVVPVVQGTANREPAESASVAN